MYKTFSSSCDADSTDNMGEMWLVFYVNDSNVTAAGLNINPSDKGKSNYDSISVTVYRGNLYNTNGCTSFTKLDSISSCFDGSIGNMDLSGLFVSGILPQSNSGYNAYSIRIYERQFTPGNDTPKYIRVCAWTYDSTKVNPCITPPIGPYTDLTPDKAWGTDANGDGIPDTSKDWCSVHRIVSDNSPTSLGSDIKCTTNNSSSIWATFEYNSRSVTDYGYLKEFRINIFGDGVAGKPVYAQVYNFSNTACPIGNCFMVKSGPFDVQLSLIGLTNNTKYYLRIWSAAVASNATVTGFSSVSVLENLVNDYYENAPTYNVQQDSTVLIHATTNGATCGYKYSENPEDCGFQNGCGGFVPFLSTIYPNQNNTNTNDTWFKLCAKNSGVLSIALSGQSCAGTTGTQFWILPEGIAGKSFCSEDHVVEYSGWDDFGSPLICSSPGNLNDTVLFTDVVKDQCYYLYTDGYRGDKCDYNLAFTIGVCSVNDAFYQTLSICKGDSLKIGMHSYANDGIFQDTLLNFKGCDSIILTNLTVNPNYNYINYITISNGDSIQIGNHVYKVTGIYNDTFLTYNGCNSIISTDLTVLTGIGTIDHPKIEIKILPNPSTHFVTIQINSPYFKKILELKIYDITGQEVFHSQVSSQNSLTKVDNLSSGIYFYSLKNEQEIISIGKLIVQ